MGNTVIKYGAECGQSPAGSFTLLPDEQITTVYIRSGSYLDAIQFITNKGNTYVPYGGGGGGTTRLDGRVYGFYGGQYQMEGCSVLGAIGTWTEPPPTPAAPSSAPPPVLDLKSALFGSQGALSTSWDDRAAYAGQFPSPVNLTNVGGTL